jgi:hypothetical protein
MDKTRYRQKHGGGADMSLKRKLGGFVRTGSPFRLLRLRLLIPIGKSIRKTFTAHITKRLVELVLVKIPKTPIPSLD